MKTVRVFVYGTLRKGFGNHSLMQHAGGRIVVAQATLSDHALYAKGIPYVAPLKGAKVVGEVHEIPEDKLYLYDRLEGFDPKRSDEEQYGYIRRLVTLDDGTEAFIYIAPWIVLSRIQRKWIRHVESGDFTDYRKPSYA